MKSIDLTQPGGFPLTQERLGYLQQAYTEAINALGGVFINGAVPIRISGMSVSTSGGTTTVGDGFLYYNNELIRFVTDSYGAVGGGSAVYVVIDSLASSLTYNDGSTPNVVLDKVASLSILPTSTPIDDTHFLLSSLQLAAAAFAEANIDAIHGAFISPSYVGGFAPDPVSPIGFRRAIGSKRVVIKGVTYDTTPLSTVINCPMFTLPPGCRPGQTQLFFSMDGAGYPIVIRINVAGVVSLAGDIIGVTTSGCWMNISFDVD